MICRLDRQQYEKKQIKFLKVNFDIFDFNNDNWHFDNLLFLSN